MDITESLPSSLALLATLATMLIGLVVWFGDRKNRLRISFLWLSTFVAAWIASNLMFVLSSSPRLSFGIALASYMLAVLVVVQTFEFALRLANTQKRSLPTLAILGVGYLLAVLSAAPGLIAKGVAGNDIVTNLFALAIYGLVVVFYLTASCWVMIKARPSLSSRRKSQLKIVLFGISLAAIVGVTFNLVLPIFGNYSMVQLGPSGAVFFIFAIAYSIAKYSMFDVKSAVIRVFTYTLTLIFLALVYFSVAAFITVQFSQEPASPRQVLLNTFLALLLATLFQPVKIFFDRITSKLFFRDKYNSDDFFSQLNSKLTSTTNLRNLLEVSAHIIADTLKAEQVFFFIYSGKQSHVIAGTKHHKTMPKADADWLAETSEDIVVRQFLDKEDPTGRLMTSHDLSLVLPLRHNNKLVGLLCLGDHKTSGYKERDINVLMAAGSEIVIAVQNALAVQSVKRLNSTLQQRVDEATHELRASNAQLQRLDEAKDEFVSMASHQLRTPLTSVKGYLSMLLEGDVGKMPDKQKHLVREAFISSERMVQLINDFLNVSRLRTGKFVVEKSSVNLAKMVTQEIDSMRPTAKSRSLKLEYRAPKNFPDLSLDAAKIRQVVINFIDNSLFYAKPKTAIKIKLARKSGQVVFTVEDTGIGVPESEQKHLFNKFFRATNARKQRPDGTGVGLFLAKKVIDAHEGEIIFKSTEGKGSTFGFSLPIEKLLVGNNSNQLKDQPAD